MAGIDGESPALGASCAVVLPADQKTVEHKGSLVEVEILQEVVDGSFSGGGFLRFDSIDEAGSGDDFGQ